MLGSTLRPPVKARDYFQKGPQLLEPLTLWQCSTSNMKAVIAAQLNPQKTLEQFINDRSLYRLLIVTVLILSACW